MSDFAAGTIPYFRTRIKDEDYMMPPYWLYRKLYVLAYR